MANFFDSHILSQLSGTAAEVTRERARTYDQQFRKSGADALEVGQQLLALFDHLPASMIASESREYERLIKRYGEAHPRTAEAREGLARLERFGNQAALGRVRVQRAIESMTTPGVAFFGFVHDESGKPIGGLTIRISSADGGELPQARTAEDGYFRLPLLQEKRVPTAPARKRAGAPKVGDAARSSGNIEIVDGRGRVVHRDPVPLDFTAAALADADGKDARPAWARLSDNIYREYRIDTSEKTPNPAKGRASGKPG